MTSSSAVHLTDIPQPGNDFEDYVAALFQASGYLVEKNIIERDPGDVLELDAVATDVSAPEPKSLLVEAKGGKWGYHDLFKLVGWMKYLDVSSGVFFANPNDNNLDAIRRKVAQLGVTVICINPKTVEFDFEQAGLGTIASEDVAHLWRYSNRAERKVTKTVIALSKDTTSLGAKAALDYQRLVRDGVFFAQSVGESLQLLYEAYKTHPTLTLGCANELAGGNYDPTISGAENSYLRDSLLQGQHSLLQATMYLEHRARLAIVRYAAELCGRPDELTEVLETGLIPLTTGEQYSLPVTFVAGLQWLSQRPTSHRYPLLWQQLLWGWGGFYLTNRKEQEVEWMSSYSGIPLDEMPDALETFDRFFPMFGKSWFTTIGPSSISVVRMTPMVFEGIGAHHRLQQYGATEGYSMFASGDYTQNDLVRWNNYTVGFLQGE